MSRTALCSDRVLLNDCHVHADLTSSAAPVYPRLIAADFAAQFVGGYRRQVVRSGSGEPVNSDSRYGF